MFAVPSACLFLAAGSACGQGLISIPTADTIDVGHLSVDLQLNSAQRLKSPDSLWLSSIGYGVAERIAIGLDLKLSTKTQLMPNVTWIPWSSKKASAAVGWQNVGVRSFGEQPFAVASILVPFGRAHLGWTRDDRDEAMAGIEIPAGRDVTWQADVISGSGNFASAGLQWAHQGAPSVSLAYMRANDRHTPSGVFLDIGFVIPVEKPQGSR